MTRDEIKSTTSMKDVLLMYGIKTVGNSCSCPFHGDKHPSMKIYPDGYKCFACGEYGDIFSFVMKYKGCDFKEAFKILGGEYKHMDPRERKVTKSKYQRKKEERERAEKAEKDFKEMLSSTITVCRKAIEVCEPMGDMWTDAQNYLPFLMCAWEEKYIDEGEVNRLDVYRKCRAIKQRFGVG